jgi:hypothetical protein
VERAIVEVNVLKRVYATTDNAIRVENRTTFGKLQREGSFSSLDFQPQPGKLYTRVRAISARVNRNYDGFPSGELKKAYKTFINRPVFVNHSNSDHTRSRGIILDSEYHENGDDKYIELFIEIDAQAFPKLAKEIVDGNIDSVSMGCFVPGTLVTLADGTQKSIESIVVGDEVLTHTGKTQPVTYIMEREYDGTVYELGVPGQGINPFVATEEHPIWIRRGDNAPGWVEIKDVVVGDFVYTPDSSDSHTAGFGVWREVVDTATMSYRGLVYNFSVEGDNSYVANDIAVHNCDVEMSVCSYCENKARTPDEFCDHIRYNKGEVLQRQAANGQVENVLVYEECRGIGFFEISFVFDPADETALTQEVIVPRLSKKAYGERTAPAEVDTLRDDSVCPQCGNDDFNGVQCKWCTYTTPPDQLKDPDTSKAKDFDAKGKDDKKDKEKSDKDKDKPKTKKKGKEEEMAVDTRKPSLSAALAKRRLDLAQKRIADISENVQPDEGAQVVKTPAPQAGISTEEVKAEGTPTDVTNLDEALPSNVDLKADEKVDVTNLNEARVRAAYRARAARRAQRTAGPATQGDGKGVGQDGGGAPSDAPEAAKADQRVDVTAPVANTTDDEAQASQYDPAAYDAQGNGVAKPDLSTDQNWVPPRQSRKRVSPMKAMILTEKYVEAGIISHDERLNAFAEFEKLPEEIADDRLALLAKIASVQPVVSQTRPRSMVPRSAGRTASRAPMMGMPPQYRTAGNDSEDTTLLFV